jgi:hypothetical protein
MVDEAAEAPSVPLDAELETECFFITPIGKADSPVRKRADGMLRAVVEPAAEAVGLEAVRADKIEKGGHVTLQVLEHCAGARASVADLTGGNLNVYYEVGIRHALRQPVVLVADEAERGNLPFDLLQQRTIFYTDDMEGAAACRHSVTEHLRSALAGNVDSPVQAAINLGSFQQGDIVQQTLAELVTKVDALAARTGRAGRPRTPVGVGRALLEGVHLLVEMAAERDDGADIIRAVEVLAPPVLWVTDHSIGRGVIRRRTFRDDPDLEYTHGVLSELMTRRAQQLEQEVARAVSEPVNDEPGGEDESEVSQVDRSEGDAAG